MGIYTFTEKESSEKLKSTCMSKLWEKKKSGVKGLKQLSKGKKLRMYKRSIKLMFITQTNDFESVIWKIEQHICQSKKVTNFTPPLPPNIQC